jgi:putative transposase
VLHRARTPHERHCPAHVTLRACAGVPSFRHDRIFSVVENALRAAGTAAFRVLQFSVQSNHVHLLVEADGPMRFERGVRGLAVRVAKAVNRVVGRRGSVWDGRYHARLLRTPREVRNALVYVLNNWRRHVAGAWGFDACSSARWFGGWRTYVEPPNAAAPVAMPRTWLACVGWRRHGLIDVDERPRSHGHPYRRRGGAVAVFANDR